MQKNCTKMAGAHPRPQLSVNEQVFIVLKYTETGNVRKQSEGTIKGSFRTGTSTIADVPVQNKTILDILIVIVPYCLHSVH